MRVAAIIPAHDESTILEENAKRVWAWGRDAFPPEADPLSAGGNFILILSENGSTDSTAWLARLLEKLLADCVAIVSKEPGKGGAIKRAAAAVEADVYLMMDADLSADLESAKKLVEAVQAGADIAVGSRRTPDARVERPLARWVATAVYAAAAQAALGLSIRDLQCGCKAFSKRVRDGLLPDLREDGFFFDTEFLAKAKRAGMRVDELGVRWSEMPSKKRRSKVKLLPTGIAFLRKLFRLRQELARRP